MALRWRCPRLRTRPSVTASTFDGETVEVLAPDGLAADPRTVGNLTTFQVSGGTQALNRTGTIEISLDGAPPVGVRRPNLLGAILIKARAVARRRREKYASDRQDLARLLGYVEDPRRLAADGNLRATERRWLRDVVDAIAASDTELDELFGPERLARARQALALLAGQPGA